MQVHIVVALIAILVLVFAGTVALINVTSQDSVDAFNEGIKSPYTGDSNSDSNASSDVPEGELDVAAPATAAPVVSDGNVVGCSIIYANNPNPIVQQIGAAFCAFENACNGMISSFGIDPIHVWFGLLLLCIFFLFLSYGMTILSSKATWILLVVLLLVGLLFFFRVI